MTEPQFTPREGARRPKAGEVLVIDEIHIRSVDLLDGIVADMVRAHIEPSS